MTTSLHAALRYETAELHRRLDRMSPFASLIDGSVSVDAYRDLLGRLASAYRRLEPTLLRTEPLAELPPYRPRLPALAEDLAVLSARCEHRLPGRPMGADRAVVRAGAQHEAGHCLGLRYVIEGSTLGARQMVDGLARAGLPFHAEASRYWAVQRAAQADWTAFRDHLLALDAERPGVAQALASARHAFGVFIEAFETQGEPG